ncbi:MAG TPA: alanine racemase [Chitinispirillaceae bacterium]|nr:alanine racemase [Chitinispirillaceae bacterium]
MIDFGFAPHIEISLDNVLHNLKQIQSVANPHNNDIIAVVKDNAYGCGACTIARTLEKQGGVRFFVVARFQEAMALRNSDISSPVLVLGKATCDQIKEGWNQRIIFTINDLSDLDCWISHQLEVRFHLNIDTGMGRLGLLSSEMGDFCERLKFMPNLYFEGVFTHMARADEPQTQSVNRQISVFRKALAYIRAQGFSPQHIHFGNSATLMRFDITESTLVRPGIALYGCNPDPGQKFPLDLRPIASLKSVVIKIKKVPPQTEISYGGNYITNTETFIATIPLGYAHGLPRFLSNRGEILIKGRRFRIAGNVTMDYIMVDIGPDPHISVGDEVVAIGYQGNDCISPDEIACLGNTIGYEVLCNLSTSIDRIYLFNGSIVLHEKGSVF